MNIEDLKEEIRKNAEERIRGVESAQARIDALIARAGGPVMVCRNVQESDSVKRRDTLMAMAELGDYKYGGDDTAWIRDLTDTIDRLEAALHNVLNERDRLKKDMNDFIKQSGFYGICAYCAWIDKEYFDEPCKTCLENSNKPNFEWRGVPEVKDDDA